MPVKTYNSRSASSPVVANRDFSGFSSSGISSGSYWPRIITIVLLTCVMYMMYKFNILSMVYRLLF